MSKVLDAILGGILDLRSQASPLESCGFNGGSETVSRRETHAG